MRRFNLKILVLRISLVVVAGILGLARGESVWAGAFQLTRIGSMNVTGVIHDKWYYTGRQPTFKGLGIPGEEVKIVLDGESLTTAVEANGHWKWMPLSPLGDEEHYISFASGGPSFGFALVVGEEIPEGISFPVPAETPVAGSLGPTLLISTAGSSFLGLSYWLRRKI